MRLTYGSYSHAENENTFNISRTMSLSPRGLPFKIFHNWVIDGVLVGTSQSDLTSKMSVLYEAYKIQGQDLKFLFDNGGVTHHALLSSSTLTGTRVRNFSWLNRQPGVWGSGTEYVNRRSYRIVVDAEALADGADNLLQYTQQVTFKGTGGPRWVLAGSLNGAKQPQQIERFTSLYAIQSGFALGLNFQPSYPGSLWPLLEHQEMREETSVSGIPYANGTIAIGARWRYIHESAALIA